ncbi:MAG: Crp/Fnr family transcriptional regulator [Bacteroidia bacterium]|nr:Crp/Fnr family transcriptional regulator [Bacteroidia bacterium]
MNHEPEKLLAWMEPDLRAWVLRELPLRTVAAGDTLLRPGAFVAGVPLVMEGLIKVDQIGEDRELLLYYLHPGESCVMSYRAALQGAPSQIAALAEQDTYFYLLPADKLQYWTTQYPAVQRYYLDLYHQRYESLIETISQLAFHRLDHRLLSHLTERVQATGAAVLHLTHQQLAAELGVSREAVSRTLKKLEREGRLILGRNEIKIR